MLIYRQGWIARRAARLVRAYGIDGATALQEAAYDWLGFVGSRS